eukprot:COSAG02_NODE_2073_length_9931_cov_12.650020_4_plen_402_part_00
MAKEIGALLQSGRDELARIKVEHLIRNKNEQHALEIVELFCDLLLARHQLLESEQSLPVEMQESVFSVCWAAHRADVPDLSGVKDQFALRYDVVRRQFFPREGETAPQQTTYVNAKLLDYLSVATPSHEKVFAYLQEIARVHAPEWQPPAETIDPGAPPGAWDGSGAVAAAPPVPVPVLAPAPALGAAGDVTVTFTEASLGLDLLGIDHTGRQAAGPDVATMCVMIRSVKPGSPAQLTGQVMPGHAIKAINGRTVLGGFSLNQTLRALADAGRPVSLLVGPPPMSNPVGGGAPSAAGAPPGYGAPGYPAPAAVGPPPGFGAPGYPAPAGGGPPPGFGAPDYPAPGPAKGLEDPMAKLPAVPAVAVAAPAVAPYAILRIMLLPVLHGYCARHHAVRLFSACC